MSKIITVLSLGGGVQSSTLALMAAHGDVTPMPDVAIFADTQGEPKEVYDWLDWLEAQNLPFPVVRVTKGSLAERNLSVRTSKKTGNKYVKSGIPAFVKNEDGTVGLLGRQCTEDFKIMPIRKEIKDRFNIKRGQKEHIVDMWIGISLDEATRMKPSRVDFIKHKFPLIDAMMTRSACHKWMTDHGYPDPPRSACSFCPFHSDHEWQRLKTKSPDDFAIAAKFELDLQTATKGVLSGVPFLHRNCDLITEVALTDDEKGHSQLNMFENECEGMCGV